MFISGNENKPLRFKELGMGAIFSPSQSNLACLKVVAGAVDLVTGIHIQIDDETPVVYYPDAICNLGDPQ